MTYYTVMYITHANFKCSTCIGTFEVISIYKKDVYGKDAIVLSIKNLTWENHQTPAHIGWLMTVKLYHKTPRWNVSRWIHTGSFVPTQQDDMPASSIWVTGDHSCHPYLVDAGPVVPILTILHVYFSHCWLQNNLSVFQDLLLQRLAVVMLPMKYCRMLKTWKWKKRQSEN